MQLEGMDNQNRSSLLSNSLNNFNGSLKELSSKFKNDEALSKKMNDSVNIKDDSSIVVRVRTAEEAETVMNNTKKAIMNNREQAILAHSKL